MVAKSRAALLKYTKDELITKMEELQASAKSTATPDKTTAFVMKENETRVREAVKNRSAESLVADGAKFGLEAQRAVQAITEQTVVAAEELKTFQEAVAIEKKTLQELYDIEVAATCIAALVEDHEKQKVELEKEITKARMLWDEEARAFNKTIAQRNQDVEVTRRRDEAEYAYRTAQERSKAKDAFDHETKLAERDLNARVERVNSEFEVRLATVEAEEKKLADGRARITGIEAEIKAAVSANTSIVANSVTKDLTNKFALEKKDLDAALALANQRNAALEASSAKMAQEIVQLHAQVDAAREQVTTIANKALEASSGQAALIAVQNTVKDNGSSRNGGKA